MKKNDVRSSITIQNIDDETNHRNDANGAINLFCFKRKPFGRNQWTFGSCISAVPFIFSLSFGLRFNKRLRFGAFVTRLNIYTLDFSAVLTASKRPFSPGIDLMANETEWMLWLCFFFLYSHLISYIYYYFCWWLVIACVAYFMRFDYRQLNYLNWFGFNSKLNCIQCLCFFCFEFFVKIHKIK